MALGVWCTLGLAGPLPRPLRAPLAATVPESIAGFAGRDLPISPAELAVARPSAYLLRLFEKAGTERAGIGSFSIYVGYYDRQRQGQTLHSPKNCLPGAGWEPLTSSVATIRTNVGPVTVNRYLLQHADDKVLVLYWYQGRGRVASNEYLVKWQLLRDSALRGRSDEALVRIIVPLEQGDEAGAYRVAEEAAQRTVPALYGALPDGGRD